MAKRDSVSAPADQAEAFRPGAMTTTVTSVVADILGITEVPPEVSVFELGATSVAIAGICARIEQATGIRVQINQVFRTSTVAKLAGWLEARQADTSQREQAAAPVAPGGLVMLTPMQAAGVGTPMLSPFAWWLEGHLDHGVLRRAAADVHRRHQALWARYVTSGPAVGYAMVPADPGEPQFSSLPDADTDDAAVRALKSALLAPLRIEDGEVWRLVLVRSGQSGRQLFAIAGHASAFDAVSASIVAREIDLAYQARAAGQVPDFGPPAASLAELEQAYSAQLASADTDAQRKYWLSELDDLQPGALPGRLQAKRSPGGDGVTVRSIAFTPDELRPWHQYGQARGMAIFTWLAAAYTRALTQAGAPLDLGLVFGFPNRGSDLAYRSVTCRTMFALLRPNGPARTGGNLLARTQDAYLQAMANAEGWPDDELPAVAGQLPRIAVEESPARTIRLGEATGQPGPDLRQRGPGSADLTTELRYGTPGDDVELTTTIRTDAYQAELADQLGAVLGQVIRGGPDLLEQQTAS